MTAVARMQTDADASDARAADPPADWPNRAASRFVTTPDATWHYQRSGSGSPVLLIHGAGSAVHTWRDVLPELAASRDVIAVDLPGHGFSGWPAFPRLSLSNMSRALARFMQALDVRPSAMIAHSAGAAIALRTSLDGPAPRRIVAINPALMPYGGLLAPLAQPLAKLAAAAAFVPSLVARRARDAHVVERMLARTGSRPDAEGVRLYQALLCRERHVRATMRMMADWDLHGLIDDMAPVAAACEFIVGGSDLAVPPSQARSVHARYPETTLTLLDGLGHLAHEEAPGRVSRCISEALAR